MPDDSKNRPSVTIPHDADIEGRQVNFVPARDGINVPIKGLLHVFSSEGACHVGAVYTPLDGGKTAVYWLDQSELDAMLNH